MQTRNACSSRLLRPCETACRGYPGVPYFEAVHAEGVIWASLCAAILKRFLAHAAQRQRRHGDVDTPGREVRQSHPGRARDHLASMEPARRESGPSLNRREVLQFREPAFAN